MRLRLDEEVGVILLEPDEPEELIPVDTDDAEVQEERPRIVFAILVDHVKRLYGEAGI